jgi:outer membrane protein assembly factor BamB
MSITRKWRMSVVLVALCLCASGSLPAQTSTTLYPFGGDPGTTRSVNWPEFGFIPSGGRFNPHERMLTPGNAHQLHKLWSFFTCCSGSLCGGSSATVVNGVVYVGSYDGNVYALNATTGVKLWSFLTGDKVFSSPAVANGVVYVGSNDQNVYALNAATGAELWSYTTGYDVVSSPVVANGVVYIGSEDDSVYALSAATGAKLWSHHTGNQVFSSPTVANGVVYVGSGDGNMYALGL